MKLTKQKSVAGGGGKKTKYLNCERDESWFYIFFPTTPAESNKAMIVIYYDYSCEIIITIKLDFIRKKR